VRAFLSILLATALLPAVAAAKPYKVDVRQASGPSPFAAGCPGAAFDATNVTGQELEPSVTADPTNPRNVIGAWKQDVGPDSTRSDLVGSSHDGGRTWQRTAIPGLSKCSGGTADGGSDPWVSAGADGTTYFTGLAPFFQGATPSSAIVAGHSRDAGRTWARPATLSPPAEGNEMPAITGSRKHAATAYTVWAEFATAAIKFSRSTDRGRTWSAPVVIDPAIPDAIDLVPRLVELPSGTLVTTFARAEFATNTGKVYASRSQDGGATWSAPVELLSQPIESFADDRGEPLPQPQFPNLAAAPDGTIYATVEADSSATTGVIAVARSRDEGRSWTTVTSPGVGAYAFEPAIAVDPNGTVGITWYDLRNDRPGDAALTADVWFASSSDGGASWKETHVAGPTDLRTGALGRQNYVGEYQGIAALGKRSFGAMFVLAAPFATDGPTDVFFARIRR
jgi:hypothetical protein